MMFYAEKKYKGEEVEKRRKRGEIFTVPEGKNKIFEEREWAKKSYFGQIYTPGSGVKCNFFNWRFLAAEQAGAGEGNEAEGETLRLGPGQDEGKAGVYNFAKNAKTPC